MPNLYDTRVVPVTIGQALDGIGVSAWSYERFETCYCPNCEDEGHWMRGPWYKKREDANLAAMKAGNLQ